MTPSKQKTLELFRLDVNFELQKQKHACTVKHMKIHSKTGGLRLAGWLLLGAWGAAPAAWALDWAGNERNSSYNGIVAPTEELKIAVESYPAGAAESATVAWSTNGGANWTETAMGDGGTVSYGQNDRWQVNLGTFAEGITVRYALRVDGGGQTQWVNNGGTDYFVVSSQAAARVWAGATTTWPEYGSVDGDTAFWVDTETWPEGAAAAAWAGWSTNDGGNWTEAALVTNGTEWGHDQWHVELPGFPEGTEVRYYIRAQNGNGESFWDSNTGSDYRLRVNSLIRDVYPEKGRYDPGETVQIQVELYNTGAEASGVVSASVKQLTTEIASFTTNVTLSQWSGQTVEFSWEAPGNDFRGYGVDVDFMEDGEVRDTRSSAVDVSRDWTKFPRYGFFCDYYEGDDGADKAKEMAKFHLNAVQFYDWMWTHDWLVPYWEGAVADIFSQADGRVQSFAAVTSKVAEAKARGIFTMAYSLIYGDSGNDGGPEHLEWGAFKEPWGTTTDKVNTHEAGYTIWRMDVTNPDWKSHLIGQFLDAMEKGGFEGIHLDNLGGTWNYKYNSDEGIPEWMGFPDFIQEAREDLRAVHSDARVTHNDVAENYMEDIARSQADIYYTEVWGRSTYGELRDGILAAKAAGGGKAVVMAAYINRKSWDELGDPTADPVPTWINDASAKLMDACVFANGGFHLELGEGGEMLVNEYFPLRSPRMHPGLKRSMRDYYDFAVRYENYLFFNTLGNLEDGTGDMSLTSSTHALSRDGSGGTIWTVSKVWRDEADALSLVNLNGVDTQWRNTSGNPTRQTDIQLRLHVDKAVQRVLLATPDDGLGQAVELPFTEGTDEGGAYVEFTVPELQVWDLVIVDKRTEIKVDGWPGDWTGTAPTGIHEVVTTGGEWIYQGAANDHRTFGGASADEDIEAVRITCDEEYVYFLVKMQDITDVALPAIGVAWNSYLVPEGERHAWIGDASTPAGSIGLENGEQAATREIMVYTAGGTAKIKLWNGGVWYDPPAGDAAVAVSAGDDVMEFRINRNDLDFSPPQQVAVTLASFRSSGNEAGSDATYDTPDANNDAIDILGGDPGVFENSWGRDLDDDTMGRFYQMVLTEQGIYEELEVAYPYRDGQEIDIDLPGTYTIVVRFPESLPAETNLFSLVINGVTQDSGSLYFDDQRAGDHLGEMRFDWQETEPGAYVIEVEYAGAGRQLAVTRTCGLNLDSDGDGMRNSAEAVAGTDPGDPFSCFALADVTPSGTTGAVLRWPSETGRVYSVWCTTNLQANPQVFTLRAGGLAATPPQNVHTDAVSDGATFIYRLHVTAPYGGN